MPRRTPASFAICAVAALLAAGPAAAQVSSGFSSGRWFFGAGLGLAFGDITFIEVSPLVGYRVNDRLSVGGSLIYRYRNDDRYGQNLSTTDYGGSVFGRYAVAGPFFVHGEVEQLSYEYYRADLSKSRSDVTSVLGGGGIAQPIGRNAAFFALALYNFSYSSYDAPAPYSSPWIFRIGVSAGF